MKFSLNFLKEFFDTRISPQRIAHILTMGGLEIESIEQVGDDYIFTAEVTSNRYDWLSIFGIAYELAGLSGKKLKFNLPKIIRTPHLKGVRINIEDKKDCMVYIARLIKNVEIKTSPIWLKERVKNCGINTVNNVVDITNYCMLKWGNPLHAFDFDKIEGDIYIRRAKKGESFVGLDDKEYVLTEDNLVISDDKKVIALAGVMGAKSTEVDFTTKNILLEAAIFSPLRIRRSRRSVGLDTESSYRFERNVSDRLLEVASYEALRLISQICNGINAGYKKTGRNRPSFSKTISFDLSQLNRHIGEAFSSFKVERILTNFGFKVKIKNKKEFSVVPPFFRLDVRLKEDVFEEVARGWGYNRIKEELPPVKPQKTKDELYSFKQKLRSFLANLGLNEIVTYSLTSDNKLSVLGEKSFIGLDNPLRVQENALRTTLLLGMVECIQHNINQKNDNLKFFEIANIYRKDNNAIVEQPFLGCIVDEESGGFYYLKGVAQKILEFLNIKDFIFLEAKEECFLNTLRIVTKEKCIGTLGVLDRETLQKVNVKSKVSFFELDINMAYKFKKEFKYSPFSRYPVIYRDVSLGIKKDVKFMEIENIIRGCVKEFLHHYRILDIYRSKDLSEEFLAVTLRVFYQAKDRTLTSCEVDDLHFKLREKLAHREGVVLR